MAGSRYLIALMAVFMVSAVGCFYDQLPRTNPFDPEGITYGCSGNWQLTRLRGNAGSLTVNGTAADSTGNIYVCGDTGSTIDGQSFGGGIQDAYLIKFDPKGNWLWTRLAGGAGDDVGHGVAVDTEDNVYLAGNTTSGFDGEGGFGGQDIFIKKFRKDGFPQWTRIRGSGGNDTPYDIVYSGGALYLCGEANGAFDGQPYSAISDLVVMKYKLDGGWLWTKMRGTVNTDQPRAIAVAGNSIYVAMQANASFDGQTAFGLTDICFVKFDTSGNWIFTRQRGTANSDNVYGGAADVSGNFYIAASTDAVFDGQVPAGSTDACLVKYDAEGNWKWTRMRGCSSGDTGKGVSVDKKGMIYIAGDTTGAFDGQIFGGGSQDAFVCAYAANGNWQWTRLRGGTGGDYATAVIVDPAGNVVLGGNAAGSVDGQTYSGGTDLLFVKYD